MCIGYYVKRLKWYHNQIWKWVDKGSDFYNRSVTSWLEKNDIEMYSKHDEGESVIAKRFIEP